MSMKMTVEEIKDWQRTAGPGGSKSIARFLNFGSSDRCLVEGGKIYLPDQPGQPLILLGNGWRFVFAERQRHLDDSPGQRYFYGGVTKQDGMFLARISRTAFWALKEDSPGDRNFYNALRPRVLEPLGVSQGFWRIRRRSDLFILCPDGRWSDWRGAIEHCQRVWRVSGKQKQKMGVPMLNSWRYALFGDFLRLGLPRQKIALVSGDIQVADQRWISLGKVPHIVARSRNLVWYGNESYPSTSAL